METLPSPRLTAVSRAAFGLFTVSIALLLAGLTGDWVESAYGIDGKLRYGIQAVVMSGITLPGIWWLRTRFDLRPMMTLGLDGPWNSLKWALFGLGIVGVPMIGTLILSALFGWAEIRFNVTSAVIGTAAASFITAIFFEALPEELAIRGYIYKNLSSRYRKWLAAVVTTIAFILMPIILVAIQRYVFGMEIRIGGSDRIQVSYLITLLLFGGFLQYIRIVTGSVWACIGFHLAFLQMNRLMGPRETNLIQLAETTSPLPFQITLIGLLILMLVGLILYPRLTGRRIGWKEVNEL